MLVTLIPFRFSRLYFVWFGSVAAGVHSCLSKCIRPYPSADWSDTLLYIYIYLSLSLSLAAVIRAPWQKFCAAAHFNSTLAVDDGVVVLCHIDTRGISDRVVNV